MPSKSAGCSNHDDNPHARVATCPHPLSTLPAGALEGLLSWMRPRNNTGQDCNAFGSQDPGWIRRTWTRIRSTTADAPETVSYNLFSEPFLPGCGQVPTVPRYRCLWRLKWQAVH